MASRGPSPAVALEGIVPILRVRSLADSLDHYVRVLGFTVDWQAPGTIASVSRDRCSLMLSEGDQGHPGGWVWIGVTDVEPLCDELRRRGATIRHPPTDYPWAYEMQIEDLDGNVLRFGSEPRPDRATGPWRDMRGDLWIRSSEGAWTRADRG
jgi:hypothetical protein